MQGIIARAFEIARSGKCKTRRDMEIMLSKEGFENAVSHLHGYQFRRQLYKAMRESNPPADVPEQEMAFVSFVNR